jgi:hypothetical protein
VSFYGVFYRVETHLQTAEVAAMQAATREIWGRTPKYGLEPTVEAYAGPLPAPRRGIQFDTDIRPDGSPLQAKWYLTHTPGVQKRVHKGEDFACVTAISVLNHQL